MTMPYAVEANLDDESYDDGFREAVDDESEFLPGILGGLLPGPIGNLVGGLLGQPAAPPRPPLGPVQISQPTSGGVGGAVLQTPAGSATVQLPQPAAAKADVDRVVDELRNAINQERGRINNIEREVKTASDRATVVATELRRDLATMRRQRAVEARRQAASLARLRRDQQSQNMMNMMMSMMMLRRVEDRVDEHTHGVPQPGGAADVATRAASGGGSDNQDMMLMMLPMMMQPSDGGSGGGMDGMAMAAMMMAMR